MAAYRHVRLLIPLSKVGEVSAITSLLGPPPTDAEWRMAELSAREQERLLVNKNRVAAAQKVRDARKLKRTVEQGQSQGEDKKLKVSSS